MDISAILTALVSGGLITQAVNYLNGRRTAKKDEFSAIIEKWKEDNDRLRREVDEMQAEHAQERKALLDDLERMRREIADLRSKVAVMEATAQSDIPAPMCLKDAQGRYLSVNRAWEDAFQITVPNALGKTDLELFGPDVGAQVTANDTQVQKNGVHLYTAEEYPIAGSFFVLKYNKMAGSARIGIGAIYFPALD